MLSAVKDNEVDVAGRLTLQPLGVARIKEKDESDCDAKKPDANTIPVPPPKPARGAANEATD